MRRDGGFQKRLLCGTAAAALLLLATNASAEETKFNIAAQPLVDGLNEFAKQSGRPVMFTPDIADAKVTHGVADVADPEKALNLVLADTGLTWRRSGDTYLIVRASDPQSGSAAGDGADSGTVQALIVTAQKREEDIQDVPIAISAFTQEDLTRSQIAGGPDLMTQVPNFTFTKTNFSSYSIQIRGIGTQAISATTDPAVAVAFNNTPFVRNHFFEQEFYDLARVEVLRGPQGTLYGRNATAGVVNVISAKPTNRFEAKLSGDIANYSSTRLEGIVNIPLVEDKAALRIAGAWTKRVGFVKNLLTGQQTDGRDLWSVRATLGLEPTDWLTANLIYEHFEESDDRLRSGKQLCHKDPGPDEIGGVSVPHDTGSAIGAGDNYFSQGCKPASLYSPDSFETPNGHALAYYGPAGQIGSPVYQNLDPYLHGTQSRDLREIETHIRPEYDASADLVELQLQFDLPRNLSLTSETGFSRDDIFSFEDFNRFDTTPGVFIPGGVSGDRFDVVPENGVFCDPQLGCTDRLAAGDLSTAKSQQFSQEFRMSSDFEGAFNFNLGANFLRYDTEDKYYVFINSLTAFPAGATDPWVPGVSDSSQRCLTDGYTPSDPNKVYGLSFCDYIDPNNIHSLNDQGRNYFLSKNPYHLLSYSIFGESYYSITPALKLTAGLRWTVDHKKAPQVPSWLYASGSYGTPTRKVILEEWREPTGRLALDWKPTLSFTDETLVYTSYVHGYKAGGANPPPPIVVLYGFEDSANAILARSLTHPETFKPEFVNAFEAGTKNTLMDGRMTLNLGSFYYDYTGYQISQIVDRSAVNLNFDAKVWGAEVEADWRPLENLRLALKVGYENTRLADGSSAIDLMDRTAGHSDWTLMKPFPPMPSNCILPTWVVAMAVGTYNTDLCSAYLVGVDPWTRLPYVPNPQVRMLEGGYTEPIGEHPRGGVNLTGYPGFDPASAPNNGEGFTKDLSGNALPNAPRYTATVTADYTLPLPNDWLMTLHTDLYYQSEAWTRIFNTPGYDKLKAYTNVNFAAIFTNEDSGWNVMAYVKNVMDRDSITGGFLNSDDTGLTTNVFLTEPRLYGVRATKQWSGTPSWGAKFGGGAHAVGEPYLFTLELGGGPSRIDVLNEVFVPAGADTFIPSAGFPLSPQSDDLDWGDRRDIRLTYAPGGREGWRMTAALHYGRTNARLYGNVSEAAPGFCFVGAEKYQACQAEGPLDWATDEVLDRENYTVSDFMVGRDIGVGSLGIGGASTLSAGIRYADFSSDTDITSHSFGDRYLPPENALKYDFHWHRYNVDFNADRSFTGAGPQLSWESSNRLLRKDGVGQIDIDVGLSGGVLFGSQKVDIRQQVTGVYYHGTFFTSQQDPINGSGPNRRESRSVTVPNTEASLGLSYSIERLKIGAGYRWERYYNVIDGGVAQHKSYDRTIDGPYFKLSVGFGG